MAYLKLLAISFFRRFEVLAAMTVKIIRFCHAARRHIPEDSDLQYP